MALLLLTEFSPAWAGLECRLTEIQALRKSILEAVVAKCPEIEKVQAVSRQAADLASETACDRTRTSEIRHLTVRAKAAAWDQAPEECASHLSNALKALNELEGRIQAQPTGQTGPVKPAAATPAAK